MSFLRFGTVADYQSSNPGLLPDVQPASAGAAGTVTSIAAGTGITVTPSPIVGAGTVAITPVGTAGTYGDATNVPRITTNASGQVTGVVPTAIAFPAVAISTQDEGVLLSSTVNTLNFVGAGVTASGAGATTTVTIPAATISTQDEGVPLSSTVTTLNFVGAGVTASGAGATTTVTIPTATLSTQDEGVPLSSTVTTLNFVGAGVTASGGGATTTVTIPSPATTSTWEYGNNYGTPGVVAIAASSVANLTIGDLDATLTTTTNSNGTGVCSLVLQFNIVFNPAAGPSGQFEIDLTPFAGFHIFTPPRFRAGSWYIQCPNAYQDIATADNSIRIFGTGNGGNILKISAQRFSALTSGYEGTFTYVWGF